MISTAWYMIVFRTVHILAGVVWVGSVFLLVMFVQPSVAAIAPADLRAARTVAGVEGTLANCAADGATGCVATSASPSHEHSDSKRPASSPTAARSAASSP